VAALGLAAQAAVALEPAELGVVVNGRDPLSVQLGEYYRVRRHIPAENVVRVDMPVTADLAPLAFAGIRRQMEARMPQRVQALLLVWAQPFRVGCMSVTSAFALGFDPRLCEDTCRPTAYNPYFNSDSRKPFTDFGIRPAMSLAASSFEEGKALVDRGIAADGSAPTGSAYLMSTSDHARNVRAQTYSSAKLLAGPKLSVAVRSSDTLAGRRDVLFYFTGLRRVLRIRMNRFLPGAIADHLTSSGGVLAGGRQMSAVRWLEAGATGSYGTVVEPCAYLAKFPSPPIVMRHYLKGETLIEAYWKSVAMPSQGLFIGEPLAAPFRKTAGR
jgi:uncharacterized protein (TIGR03790 family)